MPHGALLRLRARLSDRGNCRALQPSQLLPGCRNAVDRWNCPGRSRSHVLYDGTSYSKFGGGLLHHRRDHRCGLCLSVGPFAGGNDLNKRLLAPIRAVPRVCETN